MVDDNRSTDYARAVMRREEQYETYWRVDNIFKFHYFTHANIKTRLKAFARGIIIHASTTLSNVY